MFLVRPSSITMLRGRMTTSKVCSSGLLSTVAFSKHKYSKDAPTSQNVLYPTSCVHQSQHSITRHVRTSAIAKTSCASARINSPPIQATSVPSISVENDQAVPKNALVEKAVHLGPGIVAAGSVVAVSTVLASQIGQALATAQGVGGSGAISAVPVAIITGMLLNNTLSLPSTLKPGLKFCTTTILRAGIVCIGIKLSMFDLVKLGGFGVPVVIGSIGAGLAVVPWLNNKLGLPSRLGVLIAAGSSICGVTAIASVAPAIKANEREVALAVANVALFGTFGMLCYPHLAHSLLHTAPQIGMFLGTAIHDTSQVMGSAMSYVQMYGDEAVMKVAAVTKLTRNLFLAAVIPGLTWYYHGSRSEGGQKHKPSFKTLFPTFILGFALMALARTGCDALLENGNVLPINEVEWKQVTKFIGDDVAKMAMGTAMAALGLSTSFSVFKGVGARAFLVGWSAALVVGGVGLALSHSMAPLIDLEPEVEERENAN